MVIVIPNKNQVILKLLKGEKETILLLRSGFFVQGEINNQPEQKVTELLINDRNLIIRFSDGSLKQIEFDCLYMEIIDNLKKIAEFLNRAEVYILGPDVIKPEEYGPCLVYLFET